MHKKYDDTCRICLNNDVNCLKYEIFAKEDENNYDKKINHVTGLHVNELINLTRFLVHYYDVVLFQITEDDGFPRKICSLCSEKLFVAYDFKVNCLLSDEILRNQVVDDTKNEEDPAAINLEQNETILKTKSSKRKSKELKIESKNYKVPQDHDYECFICNEYFDLISEKDIHVRRDHQNDIKICPICNTRKQTAISFEAHLRYHKFGYRFLCCKLFFLNIT